MLNNDSISFYILITLLGGLIMGLIPAPIFSDFSLITVAAAFAGVGTFIVLVWGNFS